MHGNRAGSGRTQAKSHDSSLGSSSGNDEKSGMGGVAGDRSGSGTTSAVSGRADSTASGRTSGEGTFRATGPEGLREEIARLPADMLDPRERLERMVRADITGKPFSELTAVTYDHEGAELAGHVMLDTLEEYGFSIDDFDAVGALTAAAIPLVSAVMHAAASRGQAVNGFVMDFVYPSVKGPSVEGRRVILLDAWLSEKSFVQTSSLVTLRHGNELNLDFAVLKSCGARLLAIASLVGSVGIGDGREDTGRPAAGTADNSLMGRSVTGAGAAKTIDIVDPVTGGRQSVPFIPLFEG
ncbi:hypothetical protein [Scardovia wiggsiae]|uniref:hypothetical protein n=1 Tax=Scardovia wiggsiae TaxID=230143 RepID=UPI00374FAE91